MKIFWQGMFVLYFLLCLFVFLTIYLPAGFFWSLADRTDMMMLNIERYLWKKIR